MKLLLQTRAQKFLNEKDGPLRQNTTVAPLWLQIQPLLLWARDVAFDLVWQPMQPTLLYARTLAEAVIGFIVRNSAGLIFLVPYSVRNSSGAPFAIDGVALDSDGNSFTYG